MKETAQTGRSTTYSITVVRLYQSGPRRRSAEILGSDSASTDEPPLNPKPCRRTEGCAHIIGDVDFVLHVASFCSGGDGAIRYARLAQAQWRENDADGFYLEVKKGTRRAFLGYARWLVEIRFRRVRCAVPGPSCGEVQQDDQHS